jgi:N-acetylneuraminate lyase
VAPTFTPFDSNFELNTDVVPAYADYLRGHSIGDVFVNGTTGESASLTTAEARLMIETWCRVASSDLRVIAHVGHASVREAMELARHAQAAGVHAIAAAPPYYFRPERLADLVDSMALIAGAAPDTPFYYYHIPSMSGVLFPMAGFMELAADLIPSFAGIKFTYEDLSDYRLCLDAARSGTEVFFGRDEMLLGALATGARGAIGTTFNVMPQLYLDLTRAFDAADWVTARQLQSASCEVIEIAKCFGAIPAFKAMMAFRGIECGPCRPPLRRLDVGTIEELRQRLAGSAFAAAG